MNKPSRLSALERDGTAFAESCAAAGLGAAVDSCPGWTVADLVWHLTEVHQFWRTIVGERRPTWEDYDQPARPSDDDLLRDYRSGLSDTLTVLSAADPAQPNWTWSSDHSAGFVIRRMAQETSVHRWDADSAAANVTPIDALLASDGIDEFFTHMISDVIADAMEAGGSVHLHCTDVAGEWTVRPSDDGAQIVTREHEKGDAAMRGTASDLLLVLWRRQNVTQVDVIGDSEVAKRFVARTSLD